MRALSVGELLDVSFSAVRRNFATLALCTLVVIIPVTVLSTLVTASTTEQAFDFDAKTLIDQGELGAYLAGNLVALSLTALGSMLATAACLRAVSGDIVGTRYTAGESLRFAAARFGPLVWVSLLYFLALMGGVLLLVIGIVWVWVLFALNAPALLFEDRRGTQALKRSRELIEGHWWRTFAALLVMYLITAVLGGLLSVLVSGVILADSNAEVVNAVALTVVNIAAYAISLPLTATLIAYIYFDLRVRKEGLDITTLAGQAGAPAAAVEGLPPTEEPRGFLPPRAPGG